MLKEEALVHPFIDSCFLTAKILINVVLKNLDAGLISHLVVWFSHAREY